MSQQYSKQLSRRYSRAGVLLSLALFVLATFGCNYKPKLEQDSDTTKAPPGYPNRFPYTSKRWQEGKIPPMPGIPLPPSQGGTPPPPDPTPAASK